MINNCTDHLFTNPDFVQIYGKYRMSTPTVIVDKIMDYLKDGKSTPFTRYVDVGCGSGQSTRGFAPYFQQVIGQDISETQIQEARKLETNSNVSYTVGRAENLRCEDESCDLVNAGSAAHWFDLPKFFKEAERILVPNGALCMYGYGDGELFYQGCADGLRKPVAEMFRRMSAFWHPKLDLVKTHYSTVMLPFDPASHVRDDEIYHTVPITMSDTAGIVRTLPAFQSLKEKKPDEAEDILREFIDSCLEVTGTTDPDSTNVSLKQRYFLLMCRKSATSNDRKLTNT